MIRLETLTVTGFGVFRDTQTVDLVDQGRVLVLGENQDTDAADSNGAGKTTVLRALSWGLYGRTISGLPGRALIHAGERAAQVVVIFGDGLGARFRVTRRVTRRGGGLSLARIDVTPPVELSQSEKRATQASLEALLGLDWDGWRCTVLFGQGDRGRFASPDLTDAARKAVLAHVLDLGRYEAARERARSARAACDERLAELDAEAHTTRASLSESQARAARAEGMLEGLSVPETLAASVAALSEEAVAALAAAAASDVEQAGLAAEVTALEALRGAAQASRTTAAERAATALAERAVTALALAAAATDGPCPTCGAERSHDQSAHEMARQGLAEATAALSLRQQEREVASEALTSLEARLSHARLGMERAAAQAARARQLAAERKSREASDRAALAQLTQRRAAVSATIAAAVSDAEQTQAALEVLSADRVTIERERAVNDWWVRVGFGPKGVPAFAIEQALPVLNAHTNRHLIALTDGDIQINWRPTAEAANGSRREALTPELSIEGVEGATPSGGQQKKIELACEVALAEMTREGSGVGVDAMFLDEVLDGLDAAGQSRVCDWLETLGVSSLFVISHDSTITERFERALIVTKLNGASKVCTT